MLKIFNQQTMNKLIME